jgi:type I restriction enzyme M protein
VTVANTTSSADARQLVDKLWNYCHVLRHDGVSTIDYVDQLTLLLFLKMAQERADRKLGREEIIPKHLGWQRLLDTDAKELKDHYEDVLDQLGNRSGRWAGSSTMRKTRSVMRPL